MIVRVVMSYNQKISEAMSSLPGAAYQCNSRALLQLQLIDLRSAANNISRTRRSLDNESLIIQLF